RKNKYICIDKAKPGSWYRLKCYEWYRSQRYVGTTYNATMVPLQRYRQDVLNTLAKELKNEHKCDLVIALSHCGLYTEIKGKFIDDEYIATHVENVDIIVGGHSHTNMENMLTVKDKQGKDVIIVHDGEKGEYIGRLDLYW
ncbi:MAG: metallophosphoesterase, partial [Bacteroidales bacterium]|nr:metallophosphoesterase [Bacteroidales bacterium]